GGEGPSLGPIPGAGENTLGTPPGASGNLLGSAPAQEVLGGRPGASVPRVPTSATQAGGGGAGAGAGHARPIAPLAETEIPEFGLLTLPEGPDDEGPPDGMTLDQAIERLVRDNLDLRSKFFEIPQAEADILTASLRANPLLYADSQLIP